jgi:ferredoxin-NADP reductase/ferredoxin
VQPKPEGPALLRNYSLSDLPATDHYRVSVKQEMQGAASTYLHTKMREGDLVDVAAPRGSFTLRPGEKPIVLVSAGVGATPVLAMLHALANEAWPRPVWWLFGARSREDHPFAEESRGLVKKLPQGKSYIWYSRPSAQDHSGTDFDAEGHMAVAMFEKLGVSRGSDFYLCGPAAFLADVTAGLAAWGVASEQVHAEIFGAGKAITPGIAEVKQAPAHAPVGAAGPGPRVSFARSNLNACWDPKFSSLLDFAEACDVPVRWSCRTGVCHTCESGLISGSVVYDPEPLEPAAQGNVLICCSRPQGEVVVDL